MTSKQDISYAQDMIPHHEEAIKMSATEYSDGEDTEMRDFALRVFTKQKEEIAWLREWLQKNGQAEKKSGGM